jgi:hypothetical protein
MGYTHFILSRYAEGLGSKPKLGFHDGLLLLATSSRVKKVLIAM